MGKFNHQDYVDFISGRFSGDDVHIVASGPSLFGFDYSFFDDKRVIAVNHAYKKTAHEFCVFVDANFAERESPGVVNDTFCVSYNLPRVKSHVKFSDSKYFSENPANGVYIRRSSGVSALTIALQGGAERVFLWGFDCDFFSPEKMREVAAMNNSKIQPENRYYGHCTSGEFCHARDTMRDRHIFDATIDYYRVFPKEKIVNMSKFSAIPYFDRMTDRMTIDDFFGRAT